MTGKYEKCLMEIETKLATLIERVDNLSKQLDKKDERNNKKFDLLFATKDCLEKDILHLAEWQKNHDKSENRKLIYFGFIITLIVSGIEVMTKWI